MPPIITWTQPARATLALYALLATLAFSFQGSRPIWEPDEGRYVAVALQMLESGDWWTLRIHPEQRHLTKPPLAYWLIASSMAVFGRNEWALRLPYALAFLLSGLVVLDIARSLRLANPHVAAAVWATSLGPFAAANLVTADMILAALVTSAVAAALHAGLLEARPLARGWLIAMWLAFGLGFLTKGPPALLPLAALLAYRAWRRLALTPLFHPAGVTLFIVTGLTWFVSMVAQDPALLRYFVGYELIDRIGSGVHDRNASWRAVITVYGPAMLGGALPWSPLLLWHADPDATRRVSPPVVLLWLWLAIPLAVFALVRSRMPIYVLPLFVPIALLAAPRIGRLWERHPRGLAAAAGIWVLGLLALKAAAAYLPATRDARAEAATFRPAIEAMSRSPDEIVFVGTRARYGLRFYLGLPIEQVDLHTEVRPDSAFLDRKAVCAEARAPENPLWVVARENVPAFRSAIEACGFRTRQLASA
ncbi:MAG TPA: glycosyltransferase family 39 protein, partial [Steroidobacteraceae bacterium]|nr:glycosyltransferase family 39 protein [Steroidobacteraceae bacterium]